jgi:hypothetical protein
MNGFSQYDKVRVVRLPDREWCLSPAERAPQVGDIAYVIELYDKPDPGYELECSNPATGESIWQLAFKVGEIELERVAE